MSADSLVRCMTCGKEQKVRFATCLRGGWPLCHGYTMRLIETKADIDQAVGETIQRQMP